jgi:hypothetical protein
MLISMLAPPRAAVPRIARVRRCFLLIVVFVASLTLAESSAPAAAQAVDVTMELREQPVFYEAQDRLGIEVQISNQRDTALEDLTLNVSLLPRVTSRFSLEQSFEGLTVPGGGQLEGLDSPIPSQTSETVQINTRVRDMLSLVGDTESGVYPLTITLFDDQFSVLDSFTSYLLYYPSEVETPLNFSLVVSLNDLPARAPNGHFDLEPPARPSVSTALSTEGWLGATLQSLRDSANGGLRFGLAPTPRLVEEIADLSDGYAHGGGQASASDPTARAAASAIDDLGALMNGRGVQPLLVPYGWPDLPTLAATLPEQVPIQIAQGQEVLDSVMEVDPGRRWLYPPGERIDGIAVAELEPGTGESMFFSGQSLTGTGGTAACASPTLTLTCPVEVDTPEGSITGFQADRGLQERLNTIGRGEEDRLDLQRFFAETAMIREELPGTTARIVHATTPASMHPNAATVHTLYEGLTQAPWLRTVTPGRGLSLGIEPVERELNEVAPPVPGEVNAVDALTIDEAARSVQEFSEIRPPDSVIQRLARNVLVAQNRAWITDPVLGSTLGLGYATDSVGEIARTLDRIRIEVSDGITLTSRSEEVPLRVVNDTGFPARLTLRLDSPRLTARESAITRTFDQVVTPMTVGVTAEASGISILNMMITPPGCTSQTCVIDQRSPTVRSTNFNNAALVITLGALVFLVGFYVIRWLRHRSTSVEPGNRK